MDKYEAIKNLIKLNTELFVCRQGAFGDSLQLAIEALRAYRTERQDNATANSEETTTAPKSEDSGMALRPEEAIKAIQNIVDYWQCRPTEREAAKLAIEALREKQLRENLKPLSLEELMQRDGKPVFIISGDKKDELNGWFIVSASIHNIETEHGADTEYNLALFDANDELYPEQAFYGMTHESDAKYGAQFGLHLLGWYAYDHEPKEAR